MTRKATITKVAKYDKLAAASKTKYPAAINVSNAGRIWATDLGGGRGRDMQIYEYNGNIFCNLILHVIRIDTNNFSTDIYYINLVDINSE